MCGSRSFEVVLEEDHFGDNGNRWNRLVVEDPCGDRESEEDVKGWINLEPSADEEAFYV